MRNHLGKEKGQFDREAGVKGEASAYLTGL